jgi:hypothetical protein
MKLVMPRKAVAGYKYDPRVDGVTQSSIATWLDCREKARQRYILGWRETRETMPRTFGDIFHGVLQQYRQNLPNRPSFPSINSFVEVATNNWLKTVASSSANHEIAEECAAIILQLFPLYVDRWFDSDQKWKWVQVEKSFRFQHQDGWVGVGKVDGLALNEKGEAVLVETKTKGWIKDQLFDWLPLDLQLGYYLTALHEFKPYPCKVLYDIIKRPGERRKKDENLYEYAKRCAQGAAQNSEAFQRFNLTLSPEDLARHRTYAYAKLACFSIWAEQAKGITNGIDPLYNPGACSGKYGMCPYLGKCATGSNDGLERAKSAHTELV